MRFIVYATWAVAYLQYFVWERLLALWQKRRLPSVRICSSALGRLFALMPEPRRHSISARPYLS